MSQYIPTGNNKWINNDIVVTNISGESDKLHILEVDLQYLKNLHDLHNDLILAVEQIKMNMVYKLISNLRFTQSPRMKKYIDLNMQ